MKTIDITTVAQMCHAANVIYANSNCELKMPQKDWKDLGEGAKNGMEKAIEKIMSGEIMTPREAHDSWMKDRRAAGWVYGVTKDEDNKTHPDLVEYDELPDEQKVKDDIFFSIVFGLIERDVFIRYNDDAPARVASENVEEK